MINMGNRAISAMAINKWGEGPEDMYQIFTRVPGTNQYTQVIMNKFDLKVFQQAEVIIHNGNVIKNRFGKTTDREGVDV